MGYTGSYTQYVNNIAAPLLAELDKLKNKLVDTLEINEKMKLCQVKMEEQSKLKVEKVAILEAEKLTLTETLATKEEVIKVLTDGANREGFNAQEEIELNLKSFEHP